MSDTRFVENGKYFYDLNNDNNYYPNVQYPNSRYNYNPGSFYGKTGDSYEYNNNGERYQSQNDFQDEQYVP
uniref:Uncharacterized protein n=1 Tax=Rhizophora mucronata TaxID=61149 RepID=A0A2P2PBX2_RHIMU